MFICFTKSFTATLFQEGLNSINSYYNSLNDGTSSTRKHNLSILIFSELVKKSFQVYYSKVRFKQLLPPQLYKQYIQILVF